MRFGELRRVKNFNLNTLKRYQRQLLQSWKL